jgi:hypothetical protein
MIFRWDRWTDKKEDRIDSISIDEFKCLLEEKCHLNKFLYKKIYQPKFKIGMFNKTTKITESYLTNNIKNTLKDENFPLRENSLVCYNYIEKGEGKLFLVFPFKESLFTISPLQESLHASIVDEYKKGYWKDKVRWLDNLKMNELWTDGNCILIEKHMWDKLYEYDDYKDTDYTLTDRNILATTLIGEAGGKVDEMKKVMNVLNNRAKKKGTTPKREALRAMQFSMWNSAYEKHEKKLANNKVKRWYTPKGDQAFKNVIKTHKTSPNWAKKHWEAAYKIVDDNIKSTIPDTTNGANLYYAVSLEPKGKKPYWAKLKNWKETTRTSYHAFGKLT